MAKLVICDLDGTLVDSRHDLAEAGNAARAAIGLAPVPLETVAGYVGDGAEKLIERLTPDCAPAQRSEAMRAFKNRYREVCCVRTRPYEGITDALAGLTSSGWILGVATNKPLEFTQLILDACGLARWFAHVRGGDRWKKPDPGQLLDILQAAQCDPASSWMVGDHHTDIIAARAAGVSAAWCAWGIGRRDDLAVDAIVDAPASLPSSLARAMPSRA
ncbi:MAG: HAD-IA family hydrolase [Planctomycetes bacterium]|nr:HAD-IA family hydrolase [Planctomycetota bacterium]